MEISLGILRLLHMYRYEIRAFETIVKQSKLELSNEIRPQDEVYWENLNSFSPFLPSFLQADPE